LFYKNKYKEKFHKYPFALYVLIKNEIKKTLDREVYYIFAFSKYLI